MIVRYEHLVVLMMENRSFDHMLGFLEVPGIEGLRGDETNPDSTGEPVRVSRMAQPTGDLGADPRHDFRDVNLQIFGNEDGVPGREFMKGFVLDYETASRSRGKGASVMKCWDPARLTVLSTLASQYAVCDHWYSSVPGPTLPNRAFVHAATSRGRLDMSPDFFKGFHTIYSLLDDADVTSTIYFHDFSAAISFESLLFGQQERFFSDFNDFRRDCDNDNLPSYVFLEPRYHDETDPNGRVFPQNDQHPDGDVFDGEELIAEVYRTLATRPDLFRKTLLVIVYDEHGGLFDHVLPPVAESPDGLMNNPERFRFDRLGVRVPAVVVSPWIKSGTVLSKTFDHTSLIAAARKMFTPAHADINFLSLRDKQAASDDFGQLAFFGNLDNPRADIVTFPPRPAISAAPPSSVRDLTTMQKDLLRHAAAVDARLGGVTGMDPTGITTREGAAAFLKALKNRGLSKAAQGGAGV